METFEKLQVWQKSKTCTLLIYQYFKDNKDYSFKDQIQRAGVSIMNNIAEWYEKWTTRDKQRFFYIAKWSCGEVRSMLVLALELKYISEEEYDFLHKDLVEISKMLHWLIQKIEF